MSGSMLRTFLGFGAVLFSACWPVCAAPAPVSDAFAVLPALSGGVPPGLLLEEQLKQAAYRALEKREAAYEQIKTPADVALWQEQRRARFVEALGGFPERTPLNARVTGRRQCAGYRMEKVLFESQPGFLVSGLLYLPEGAGPHPAVLMPCGHTPIAKAGEVYQKASISMALAGIAAFCYDPIGQGERRHYRKEDRTPEFPSSTSEHQLLGISGIPLGTGLARAMIWDGMRALDYLQSRGDIRGDRLGCTGVSGGGTMTSFLMALDGRLSAAAPACYLTGFKRLLETIGPQDFEQNIFGQLEVGLDHADYVLAPAPKPELIMAATRDFFDIQGTWNVFRQAKRVYGRLGFAERVELIEADTKHDLAREMREASARWFRRWLAGRDDAWSEPAFELLPEAEVLCTAEGDVLRQAGARSFVELNVESADRLAAVRSAFWRNASVPERRSKVREVAGIRPLAEVPLLSREPGPEGAIVERGPVRIEKLLLRNDEGTVLPCLLFRPAQSGGGVRLFLHAEGKQAGAQQGGQLEALALAGETVLAVDVRGLGELQPAGTRGGTDPFAAPQWKAATLAYLLGRSLVGMRAEDVLACARFASEQWNNGGPVRLTAGGEAGVPALHAAALEPQLFAQVRLERTLRSWDLVVRSTHSKNQQASAVHAALRLYDLPDLAAALPGETLSLVEPVDAMGSVLPAQ
jgi:cephalosporin-C deacetylase-like acetyl esterase